MKRTTLTRIAGLILAGWLSAELTAQGQQTGFGGQQRTGASRAGTTSYPSSTDIGQARITYDAETRSIIIVADEDTAAHITNVVRQLDQATPQVLINCVFMEATYSKGTDIGVDGIYRHTVSSSVDAFNGIGAASTAFDLAASGGLYTFIGKDLTINFAALAKAGKTEILSRPSILARNNQQATITIGQEVPIIGGVTYDNFGNQRNAIDYRDVGIILQVTPFITSDGMVEMIVAPEVSSVSDSTVSFAEPTGTNGTTSATTAPIINVRSADTVVVVPDGQTVVIGGLMQTLKTKTEKKVPILGDIPLLGLLFKHTVSGDEKKELLIFMTPHIVKRPSDLAAHTTSERLRAGQVNKAFPEEELNRFLDQSSGPQFQNPPAAPKAKN